MKGDKDTLFFFTKFYLLFWSDVPTKKKRQNKSAASLINHQRVCMLMYAYVCLAEQSTFA